MKRYFSCCRRKEGASWFEVEEPHSSPISSPVHSMDSSSDKERLSESYGGDQQTLVEEYEDCLRRYELLQMDFLTRGGRRSMISKLKADPDSLVGEMNVNSEFSDLINEAKRMNDLESKMGEIRHAAGEGELVDDYKRDKGEDDGDAEEKDDEDDEFARKSTSVGTTLMKKLKRIDATQGTLSMSTRANTTTESTASASTSASPSPEKKNSRKSFKNVLHVKQKWPEWLVDESYEVVKVTKYGIKYNRSLKLTQYHVLACSDKNGVTKVFSYLDLVDIRVLVESSEEERVTLVFKTGGSGSSYAVFDYLTPMAAIIANQITTRVKIRRTLSATYGSSSSEIDGGSEKSDLRPSIVALDPSVTDNVLKMITSANIKSKTSAIIAFAECLVENLVPSKNETDIKGDRSSLRDLSVNRASVGHSSGSHSGSGSRPSSDALARAAGAGTSVGEDRMDDETMAQYLIVVKRNSPEFYVQQAVKRVLLHGTSMTSAEHDTRAHFLDSMREKVEAAEAAATGGDGGRAARAVLKEARMFIEGMHEYLLLKRGPSLATIHVWGTQLQSTPAPSPSHSHSHGGSLDTSLSDKIPPMAPPGSSPAGSSSRGKKSRSPSVLVQEQISGEDLDRILDKHLQHQRETNGVGGESDGDEEAYNPLTLLRYHTLLSISYIAYSVVEESIFAELKPNLMKLIRTTDDVSGRDALLSAKIRGSLCQRSQADWGIPESNRSPLGWEVSINELNTLEQHNTPSSKLAAIVVAAKNIFAEYATVKGEEADAIGADDLVPIFIYILAQTNLEDILGTKELLWNLCHPSLLHGESGYYLTVFESAASFLEEYEQ